VHYSKNKLQEKEMTLPEHLHHSHERKSTLELQILTGSHRSSF